MAVFAYATIEDYDNHQLKGDEDNPQLQFRLDSARDRITSCLYGGKYNVSSIVAVLTASGSYAILKELNIILAHIALIMGDSASSMSDSAGATYLAYKEWAEETLQQLCEGKIALMDQDGNLTAPPNSSRIGILADNRKCGQDLVAPVDYTTTDVLGIQ